MQVQRRGVARQAVNRVADKGTADGRGVNQMIDVAKYVNRLLKCEGDRNLVGNIQHDADFSHVVFFGDLLRPRANAFAARSVATAP